MLDDKVAAKDGCEDVPSAFDNDFDDKSFESLSSKKSVCMKEIYAIPDNFASPKLMYLSFYRAVSAHLLTVLYQMLGRVQEYVSLGVIWVMGMVLGWFSNSLLLFQPC